jgi:hypothetical protein
MKRWEFIAGLGSAAAWPIAARGFGFLSSGSLNQNATAFRRGLAESGYVEGIAIQDGCGLPVATGAVS